MAIRTKPYVPNFSSTAARMTEPCVGRLGVGVGQPRVEREHRHLDAEADEHAAEDQELRAVGDAARQAGAARACRTCGRRCRYGVSARK